MIQYVIDLRNELKNHQFSDAPYKFSSCLFTMIMFPCDEDHIMAQNGHNLNVNEIIMSTLPNYMRIYFYYFVDVRSIYNSKLCNICAHEYPPGFKFKHFMINFEIDINEFVGLLENITSYCSNCFLRLYYIKESDNSSRDDFQIVNDIII